jgi:Alpha/beta hydrolase of unknown function (DUF900)
MFFLNTRSLPVGGGVVVSFDSIQVLDQTNTIHSVNELTAAIQGRDVLLVTHGFNVNQADGLQKLSNWRDLLSLGNAVPVGILWPGDSRWIHVVDYPIEGNDAMAAGNLLATFLNKNFTGALSLSFASHSLGARVVLQTVSGLNRPVRRLLLMAGAVDNTCLSSEYANAAKNIGTISLLASRADHVLEWAFPAGNFVSGIFSRGVPYIHEAIGREGPSPDLAPPSNLHPDWQIPDGWDFDHGDYLPGSLPPQPMPPVAAFPGADPPSKPAWSAAFETSRWP